jgi:hypothetical protein
MYAAVKYSVIVNPLLLLAVVTMGSAPNSARAQSVPHATILVRGGGKTIIQGGRDRHWERSVHHERYVCHWPDHRTADSA